ncbi:hypothetical protein FNU76_17460 [Chitinimonas arctica]|uniref:Uncharacterized protein n=1 Tax=Chitinimonas arctica TaxID=2594795 RepID=A0A516SIK4_9NEIS|nr:NUDIX domain-containing protein [Chitinimonas arctica]QDQ27989.1 hypothetical protein FNU76_17460 [Chitinimonas arctica]
MQISRSVSMDSFFQAPPLEVKKLGQELAENPAAVFDRVLPACPKSVAQARYESILVKLINDRIDLNMAGVTISDSSTLEATRKCINLNVYSRLAGGATVFPLVEKTSKDGEMPDIEVVLIKNKRKAGKLLPPEGYGKWGALKNTPLDFSRLPPEKVDMAEESILKKVPVASAYRAAAAGLAPGMYSYGDHDGNFVATAQRESHEELGIWVEQEDLIKIDSTTRYNPDYALHTHTETFMCILRDDVRFTPDQDEVESVHLINPSDIAIQRDGSGKVDGFDARIPPDYMTRLEKALLRYEEMALRQNTHGLIVEWAQLKKIANDWGIPYQNFTACGAARHDARRFAKAMAASVDAWYRQAEKTHPLRDASLSSKRHHSGAS